MMTGRQILDQKNNNLNIRLDVVNVDVMAIPCTIHHHRRNGKVVMLDEG